MNAWTEGSWVSLERYISSYLSYPVSFELKRIRPSQQAIHPSQIPIIQSTFVPTPEGPWSGSLPITTITHRAPPTEILRAAKILKGLKNAHISEARGAIGIDGEMIDAPMLKQVSIGNLWFFAMPLANPTARITQAEQIIAIAEAANLTIPNV